MTQVIEPKTEREREYIIQDLYAEGYDFLAHCETFEVFKKGSKLVEVYLT